VHLLPARDFLSGEEVDLRPLSAPASFPVIPRENAGDVSMAFEGAFHHANAVAGRVRASTLLFHSGVVEAVASLGLPAAGEPHFLPLEKVEEYFVSFLRHSLRPTSAHLSGGWPILARLAIVGAHLAPGMSRDRMRAFELDGRPPIRFHGPVLVLPDLMFEGLPENLPRAMWGAFDRLWQAWGYPRAYSYQPQGERWRWQGTEI
jgi:hypothetical protein